MSPEVTPCLLHRTVEIGRFCIHLSLSVILRLLDFNLRSPVRCSSRRLGLKFKWCSGPKHGSTHTHMHAHKHTHTQAHAHKHMRKLTHTHTHTQIYRLTLTHIHVHAYTPTYIHARSHTHTYICTLINTQTHTHTHQNNRPNRSIALQQTSTCVFRFSVPSFLIAVP